MTPLVSVVIPTHNGAATIAGAIGSVRAQQVPVEVIVVDDGSTDDTPALLETLDVRTVRQANAGPAAARNTGLKLAGAPFVAFIDDDDVWVPGRLTSQLATLGRHPEVHATAGRSRAVACDRAGVAMAEETEPWLFLNMGAALIRAEAFARIGGFDVSLAGSEDIDWYLRLRDAGLGLLITNDVVQLVRRTGENITRGKDLRELSMHRVLRRSIGRRRGTEA